MMNELILVVSQGEPIGAFIEIGPKMVTVGRSDGCALRLLDLTVSREHFRVWFDGSIYWIQDALSQNGTRVNGKLISIAPLRDCDTIDVGLSKLMCLNSVFAGKLVARLSRVSYVPQPDEA